MKQRWRHYELKSGESVKPSKLSTRANLRLCYLKFYSAMVQILTLLTLILQAIVLSVLVSLSILIRVNFLMPTV